MKSPYWRHVRPVSWRLGAAAACLLIEVAVDLSLPRLMTHLVDDALSGARVAQLQGAAAIMLMVILVGWLGGMGCTVCSIRAGIAAAASLRLELYERMLGEPPQLISTLSSGGLLTRLTADVTQLQQVLILLVRGSLRASLLLLGSLVMAFSMSPLLAAYVLGSVILCLGLLVILTHYSSAAFGVAQVGLDHLNEYLHDVLNGWFTVKVFAAESLETHRFTCLNQRYMQASKRAWRLFACSTPALLLILNLAVVIVLWLSGAWTGTAHATEMVAFINYQVIILGALTSLGMLFTQVSRARVAVARLNELLRPATEVLTANDRVLRLNGGIQLEKVCVANGEQGHVLRDMTFCVAPGERVAVVGDSGSGKSTLLALIAGQVQPASGHMRFDGVASTVLDLAQWRRQIGVVTQVPHLFSLSLEENLRLGHPDASAEAVRHACAVAQLQDWIDGLPAGMATVLERGGAMLSGGQRQRIAIARAVLGKPSIVLLDDCTSALDNHTAAALNHALHHELQGTTCLFVSQDPVVLQTADRILLLDGGRLIGQGRPEQLLHSTHFRQLLACEEPE
ncbi:ABC transporter ATP-binding protein [Pseudomonas sp. LRF_L74]|uniref:ABC transporter ATP-binding protein n=1 Tax=Pseudomonas sp. LRF_L74 TaxID=3369422 RepID=UPI003F5E5695